MNISQADIRNKIASTQTPFFLFDLRHITDNIQAIQQHIGPDALFYAVKCNSLMPVLDAVKQAGCGFEVNTVAELQKVIALGVDPKTVINSSPITASDDLRGMFASGVEHFTTSSFEQIENLRINAPGSAVAIRLFVGNEGSEFNLSDRLGIDPGDVRLMIDTIKEANLRPDALTFHVGSQCLNPDNWQQGLKRCAEIVNAEPAIETINIGGGLPVVYDQPVPSLDEIRAAIDHGLGHFRRRPRIILEPGRFVVGSSAIAVTSVIGIHQQRSLAQAVIDLSVFSGLIEVLESDGHLRYPLDVINGDAQRKKEYRLIGPTCSGTDIIRDKACLPELRVNFQHPGESSRIIVRNAGAYCLDYIPLSPDTEDATFNGIKVPRALFVDGIGWRDEDSA